MEFDESFFSAIDDNRRITMSKFSKLFVDEPEVSSISNDDNDEGPPLDTCSVPAMKKYLAKNNVNLRKTLSLDYFVDVPELEGFPNFDPYLLYFESKVMEDRFQCHLLRKSAEGLTPIFLIAPCLLYFAPFLVYLRQDIITLKESAKIYAYLVLVACVIAITSLVSYVWLLHRWNAYHNDLYNNADISVSSVGPYYEKYRYQAMNVAFLGKFVAFLSTLSTGFYVINRINSLTCYFGCVDTFPFSSTCFLLYSPFHFSILMYTKFRVSVILQSTASACVLISYIIYDSPDVVTFKGISFPLQCTCLWIFWIIVVYVIQRHRIKSFQQQCYFMEILKSNYLRKGIV